MLAAEDRRFTEVRTVTSLARWQGKNWKTPYRLGTRAPATPSCSPRGRTPYTVDDLLRAGTADVPAHVGRLVPAERAHRGRSPAPRCASRQPGGLTLRLGERPGGFATIVSFGGEIEFTGEEAAPVKVAQLGRRRGRDRRPHRADGRAYVRAVGGQFAAEHARPVATSASGAAGPAGSPSPAPTARTPARSSHRRRGRRTPSDCWTTSRASRPDHSSRARPA